MRNAVLRSGNGETVPSRANLRRILRRLVGSSVVAAMILLGGATTQARTTSTLPEDGTAAEQGAPARPVAAWTEFCVRYPAECKVNSAEPAVIPLTLALWRTLAVVNRQINARIEPITDMDHWGVVDRWDFPDDGLGDCEDIQLLKRRMLIERRLPRRALLMTVVIDDIGEGHAVLMVRTDRGDLILDNKTNAVLPWERTGYSFVKREGQDGRAWVSLNNGASPVTTANR